MRYKDIEVGQLVSVRNPRFKYSVLNKRFGWVRIGGLASDGYADLQYNVRAKILRLEGHTQGELI